MASPALSVIRQVSRDYAMDNDANSANWSVSQALQDEIINRFLIRYKLTSKPWTQDLPAATTGLTVGAGVNTIFATTITTIRHINALYLCASAGTTIRTSLALEHCEPAELDQWISDIGATGTIKRYSAIRIGDSTKAAGTVGAWMLHFYPTPTATTYLIARATLEATPLLNASDVPDLTDEEGYGIAVLAGAWMAIRCGREALAQDILSELPASMAALAQSLKTDKAGAVQ